MDSLVSYLLEAYGNSPHSGIDALQAARIKLNQVVNEEIAKITLLADPGSILVSGDTAVMGGPQHAYMSCRISYRPRSVVPADDPLVAPPFDGPGDVSGHRGR